MTLYERVPATACDACKHIVYATKRVTLMVDGEMLYSATVCLPCANDSTGAFLSALRERQPA